VRAVQADLLSSLTDAFGVRIKTAFGYVPSSRPELPSVLRQLAYQQNTPLPGPHYDPQGWKTLRPVPARGVMYKSRQVEVQCTVSMSASFLINLFSRISLDI
jgi:hypothetical protein